MHGHLAAMESEFAVESCVRGTMSAKTFIAALVLQALKALPVCTLASESIMELRYKQMSTALNV